MILLQHIFNAPLSVSYTHLEYKHHDFVTGKEEIGAPPEDVEEEMSELMSELQNIKPQNALTADVYKRQDGYFAKCF